MRVFSELLIAQTPVCEDLSEIEDAPEYIACYGKAKNLERIPDIASLRRLWISGVNPAQFEIVARCAQIEILVVHDLRVAEMASLARLQNLTTLLIWSNTKTTTLEPLGALGRLEHLALENFSKVRDIEPLVPLEALRTLSLEGSIYTPMRLETLAPLARMPSLVELRLLNVRVEDASLEPIASLRALEELSLGNLYAMEEFARLAALMPATGCRLFEPHITSGQACKECGDTLLMPTGKGARFVCPSCAPEKVRAHQEAFRKSVAKFVPGGF